MAQWGKATLWDSAADGNIEACKKRLQNSLVNINQQDNNGRTAVSEAARWGHVDTVKFLVEKGADINVVDYTDSHPLHLAAAGGYNKVVEYIVKDLHVDINLLDSEGNTPLLRAVQRAQKETVQLLLSLGANRKIKNSSGQDALNLAPNVAIREVLQDQTYVSPTQY
eukprot:TRINITY_DN3476_c0_g1_i5.p1 TRINITY_DN3476_c0_g1~~TRINITY_DN3476_c0_g1_i5.p1  ORF type:complete len:167 (+),score=28.98 TRINITY_DN3476_c0_g1_i5:86-586(+)